MRAVSVTDEGQTHRGTAEIGGAIVTARFSENFPGSPVDLDFKFTLEKSKVKSLEIG